MKFDGCPIGLGVLHHLCVNQFVEVILLVLFIQQLRANVEVEIYGDIEEVKRRIVRN